MVCIAPTGLGKTLTFWMPLLFRKDGIQIVVTPLNLLSTQHIVELHRYQIEACEVRADTESPQLFQVRLQKIVLVIEFNCVHRTSKTGDTEL